MKIVALFLISSFIFGLGFHSEIIKVEFLLVSDFINPKNSIWNQFSITFLIVFQISLLSLFFNKKNRFYKLKVILIPIGVLIFSFLNMIILIFINPMILITFLPYVFIWIYYLCVLFPNKSKLPAST